MPKQLLTFKSDTAITNITNMTGTEASHYAIPYYSDFQKKPESGCLTSSLLISVCENLEPEILNNHQTAVLMGLSPQQCDQTAFVSGLEKVPDFLNYKYCIIFCNITHEDYCSPYCREIEQLISRSDHKIIFFVLEPEHPEQ